MLQNFPRQLFHHEGGVGWYDETKNDDYGSTTHLCEIDGDDNDEVGDGDGGDYDALAMMKKYENLRLVKRAIWGLAICTCWVASGGGFNWVALSHYLSYVSAQGSDDEADCEGSE